MLLYTLGFVFCCLGLLSATNPGAKIRISQPGLNNAANIALDILSSSIGKLKIPDVRGKTHVVVGKVEYEITNMQVTGFQKPSTAVVLNPGSGLTWSASNAAITLHGDWHYKYRLGFIDIRDGGNFDGDVSDVSVSVSATLGIDASGRPSISSTACNSHVGDVHIRLHGGASWLYNLFIDNVIRPVRGDLEKLICEAARKAIDGDTEKELATMPVQVVIAKDWILDYRLVQPPAFATAYLEVDLKGEFYYKGDTTEAPYQPEPLPSPPTSDRMVTIWLSDYLLNTAGYVLYKHNILKYTLSAKDLPPESRSYLDTTCHVSTCIGGFIPNVAKLYPNCSVEIEMAVTEAPKADINSSDINGKFVGIFTYNARRADGTLAYLFRTDVQVALSLVVALNHTTIQAKVSRLTPSITVIDSAVGPVTSATLTFIFAFASKSFILPKLNAVGQRGFPLPTIKHVQFVNPQLVFDTHAIHIATDVQYLPGNDDKANELKYVGYTDSSQSDLETAFQQIMDIASREAKNAPDNIGDALKSAGDTIPKVDIDLGHVADQASNVNVQKALNDLGKSLGGLKNGGNWKL